MHIALRSKKVCYKVNSCENCQRQSFTVFIGLTIHAKSIGGERTLLPEILGQTDRTEAKSPIFRCHRPSVCRLSVVCNVGAPYSGD